MTFFCTFYPAYDDLRKSIFFLQQHKNYKKIIVQQSLNDKFKAYADKEQDIIYIRLRYFMLFL